MENIMTALALLIPIGTFVYTIFFGYPSIIAGVVIFAFECLLMYGGEIKKWLTL